ncbi:metallophosphoesterase family protein [Paenibacillus thalictri]|uniref:Metallophosphoesterase n=1 Tax=Paenibacillus thalictri TaxID=2527873 RepID=A0A4V2J4R0_9BACL|nr:metallophosphoesterase family protein [Paenibacillus thalictri]TBL80792.1 metallophosphoesterase [Paenibacillus thalictri]
MRTAPLKFCSDGTFKIVQFTDVHLDGSERDRDAIQLMERVLDEEKPDLVMYSGDLVSGDKLKGQAKEKVYSLIRECVAPALSRQLLWTAIFGNHDGEGPASNSELVQTLQEVDGCLMKAGPEDVAGVGNYVLEILGAASDQPAALLYGFDSGNRSPFGGWDYVKRSQIGWYEREAMGRRLPDGSVLPALAFLHIPLPEYNEVWDEQICLGAKYEDVCCPRINTGLFAAMVEMRDVAGVFCGHDHLNDFCGELHGIRLCYGRATGGYGYEFGKGARVIRLREGERSFDTWLRLEGGDRVEYQQEHQPEGRMTMPRYWEEK